MSRVLVVTNDFPPRRGGIESFVLALCERMAPDEVVVYTASMPGDKEYDATLPFPVYRDPSSTLLPTQAAARRAGEVMRQHGCDRVMFGASAPLGLLAPRLRRAGARRIVALTHGHEVWWAAVPITRRLLRRIGDSVDVMTYVSEWCRERIANALTLEAASRMIHLPPGVDRGRFYPGCGGGNVRRRLGIPSATPVVVCVARMVARKGQDTLVKAWPSVLHFHPTARLLLVGDRPTRHYLNHLVTRLKLGDSVIVTGSVPWEEVPAYIDAGDIFAMPCRSRRLGLEAEAFGIVFLEAQACGLPVMIGASGGAPESLAMTGSGRVVDPLDATQVGSALNELLSANLGRPNRREGWTTSDTRSWEATTNQLLRVLSD